MFEYEEKVMGDTMINLADTKTLLQKLVEYAGQGSDIVMGCEARAACLAVKVDEDLIEQCVESRLLIATKGDKYILTGDGRKLAQ